LLPDLSLLVALVFGLSALGGEPKGVAFTLAGVVGSVIAGLAWIRMAADRGVVAVAEDDPAGAAAAVRSTSLAPLVAWAACIGVFGWGALVADVVPRVAWLGRHAVLFLPAAVLFASGWVARARIESAVRASRGVPGPAPSPLQAVRQHVRRNALALLPLFVLVGLFEAFHVLGELGVPGVAQASRWVETLPLLSLAVSMTLLTLLSLLLPRLLRRVFHTAPLAAGDLRALLERAAHAMRLRYRELVVWNTGGRFPNALVVGLTGRTRMIFVTDVLVEKLPPEEVLAVFAHEAGHAKRHHLPLYLVVFFAFALLFDSLTSALLERGVPHWMLLALQLAFVWFGLVGWLSRRFEREADVYGADHATVAIPDPGPVVLPGASRPLPYGAALLVRALDRVARLTGHARSFRHGSIEDRIRYVASYATDPEARREFRRQRRGLYVVIAAFALAALGVAVVELPRQVRLASAGIRADEALTRHREAADVRAA
jgi:Zn-dependent protease with chaperone function